MLNTEMLFRMRSFLDESTAELYIDATELYVALSLAQVEIAKVIADAWHENQTRPLPRAVQFLSTVETLTIASGTYEASLTGDALQIISVQWQTDGAVVLATSPYAVELGWDVKSRNIIQNRLLSGGYYYSNVNGLITMNPVSSDNTAEIRAVYIDTPVDITASVQPELRDVAHDAIIERGLWILLKDRESEQANIHLKLYAEMVKGLIK